MVACFGAAEDGMPPPTNGWLQHADAAASGNPWAIWVGVGAAKPANGWGQGVTAGHGGADEGIRSKAAAVLPSEAAADPLTCQVRN